MALVNSAIPGASGYADAALLAKTAYDKALARNNQSTLGSMRNFGYNADVDPGNGMLTNLRVDPGNRTGVYQGMLRNHAMTDQATREDAAGRGVYGGLAEQGRTNDRYGFAQDRAQLGNAVTGAFDQYGQNMQDASFQRDSSLYEAQRQAAQDAAMQELFNQGDFSGLQYPEYGSESGPTQMPGLSPQGAADLANWKPPTYTSFAGAKPIATPKARASNPVSDKLNSQQVIKKAVKTAQAQIKRKSN